MLAHMVTNKSVDNKSVGGIVGTETDSSPWDMGVIADPGEYVCWVTPKGLATGAN